MIPRLSGAGFNVLPGSAPELSQAGKPPDLSIQHIYLAHSRICFTRTSRRYCYFCNVGPLAPLPRPPYCPNGVCAKVVTGVGGARKRARFHRPRKLHEILHNSKDTWKFQGPTPKKPTHFPFFLFSSNIQSTHGKSGSKETKIRRSTQICQFKDPPVQKLPILVPISKVSPIEFPRCSPDHGYWCGSGRGHIASGYTL